MQELGKQLKAMRILQWPRTQTRWQWWNKSFKTCKLSRWWRTNSNKCNSTTGSNPSSKTCRTPSNTSKSSQSTSIQSGTQWVEASKKPLQLWLTLRLIQRVSRICISSHGWTQWGWWGDQELCSLHHLNCSSRHKRSRKNDKLNKQPKKLKKASRTIQRSVKWQTTWLTRCRSLRTQNIEILSSSNSC